MWSLSVGRGRRVSMCLIILVLRFFSRKLRTTQRCREKTSGGNQVLDGSMSHSPRFPCMPSGVHSRIAASRHQRLYFSELAFHVHSSTSLRTLTDARVLELLSIGWSDAGADIPEAMFIANCCFRLCIRTYVKIRGSIFKTGPSKAVSQQATDQRQRQAHSNVRSPTSLSPGLAQERDAKEARNTARARFPSLPHSTCVRSVPSLYRASFAI